MILPDFNKHKSCLIFLKQKMRKITNCFKVSDINVNKYVFSARILTKSLTEGRNFADV